MITIVFLAKCLCNTKDGINFSSLITLERHTFVNTLAQCVDYVPYGKRCRYAGNNCLIVLAVQPLAIITSRIMGCKVGVLNI